MIRKIGVAILWITFSVFAKAQKFEDVTFSTNSPYHTVVSHLYFLSQEDYNPAMAAKTLKIENETDPQRLAIKLKQIFDGNGILIQIDDIPQDPNYKDSITNKQRYYIAPNLLPEVYLEKYGTKWLYSTKTVKMIPTLHKRLFPIQIDEYINKMPDWAHKRFLSLHAWQYLGILILLLFAFLLHKVVTFIIDLIIKGIISRVENKEGAQQYILKVAVPVSYFIVLWVISFLIPALHIPVQFSVYIVNGMRVSTSIFAIMVVYRSVDLISATLEKVKEQSESNLDKQILPLLRKTIKVVIIITGVLVVLDNLNVNITAFIAGLSIGGLAFALAAQDTIKNLFGSFLIFLDKPFKVGDYINIGGQEGTVEEVGIRSTRIRTPQNSLIYVPNGKLADTNVDNIGARIYRRMRFHIAITYDTHPDLIEEFVLGLREIIKKHPDTRKDFFIVELNEMGAASLDILFQTFFIVPDLQTEMKARHEVLLSILRLADRIGVRFAFPTQTLHIEEMPGYMSLTPKFNSTKKELREQVKAFIEELEFVRKDWDSSSNYD